MELAGDASAFPILSARHKEFKIPGGNQSNDLAVVPHRRINHGSSYKVRSSETFQKETIQDQRDLSHVPKPQSLEFT